MGRTRVGAGVPPAAEESTVLGTRGPAAAGIQTPIQNNASPLPAAAKPNANSMYVLCY